MRWNKVQIPKIYVQLL